MINTILRPTWVEIDLSAITQNVSIIQSLIGKHTGIIAVVKADAYGHNAEFIVKELVKQKVVAFYGVACLEEGIALRKAGIKPKILILGNVYPYHLLPLLFSYQLTPTVISIESAVELNKAAKKRKVVLPVHVKVDTGMGRIGSSADDAGALIQYIHTKCQALLIEGVYTHFSSADSDEWYTRYQYDNFENVLKSIGKIKIVHTANSATIIRCPSQYYDYVRPGLLLYGLEPFPGVNTRYGFKPVLTWKTKVVYLKNIQIGQRVSYNGTFIAKTGMTVATLPVGYADGYNRKLSNTGQVLLHGKRINVIGRVTMDMVMADVTGIKDVRLGDEVVLIGQQGRERITAEEVAGLVGTINYEIVCGIGKRVTRIAV
ncbi:MAG: alanine racemase [Elusimicrobiota bacterium]